MGSFPIVKASMVFNDDAGFGDRKEYFLVQGSHASSIRGRIKLCDEAKELARKV